jgi:hypothetical protein
MGYHFICCSAVSLSSRLGGIAPYSALIRHCRKRSSTLSSLFKASAPGSTSFSRIRVPRLAGQTADRAAYPGWDEGQCEDGTFSRKDFRFDKRSESVVCLAFNGIAGLMAEEQKAGLCQPGNAIIETAEM